MDWPSAGSTTTTTSSSFSNSNSNSNSNNNNNMSTMEDIQRILNASQNVDLDMVNSFTRNRSLEDPAFFTFLVLYTVLVCFGATGNGLVVWAVARKRSMRTARNMFIVNLAVSDLLLCVVTMPLTLMEIATKYWPLGREEFICKLIGTLQATSIFVSTISITAIALDRYQVIVYPTGNNIQKLGAIVISVMIWVVSLLLASPLFIFRGLDLHHVMDMGTVAYCIEKWPIQDGRAYYSWFSLIFQYVFPIVIVTLAYSRICKKLRYRYVNSSASKRNTGLLVPTAAATTTTTTSSSCTAFPAPTVKEQPPAPTPIRPKQAKDDRRIKRTNALFISIALIFGISWLPLNMFNLAMDTWSEQLFGHNTQAMLMTYAACHMMGMSSACTNPMLYGWLNENFRKEFREIREVACRLCCFLRSAEGAPGTSNSVAGGVSANGTSSGRRRAGRGLLGGRLLKLSGRSKRGSWGERGQADGCCLHPTRELTNGRDTVHADETTSFTNVL